MRKALAHTASYDTAITKTLADVTLAGEAVPSVGRLRRSARRSACRSRSSATCATVRTRTRKRRGTAAARGARLRVSGQPTILQGKELSYTNLLDLDAAARIALEFDEPAAVVIKHTNPCGAAIGSSAADAYTRARDADSLSAFGGIVALNRTLDVAAAEAIVSTFIEAVIVPSVDPAAKSILAKKANMRVVVADFGLLRSGGVEFRSILGAVLVQERDFVAEARQPWTPDVLPEGVRVVTKRQPTADEWEALRFAWRVGAHVKSNTVIFTDASRTLAIGAGQMSRVDAVNVAVMKARDVSGRSVDAAGRFGRRLGRVLPVS